MARILSNQNPAMFQQSRYRPSRAIHDKIERGGCINDAMAIIAGRWRQTLKWRDIKDANKKWDFCR